MCGLNNLKINNMKTAVEWLTEKLRVEFGFVFSNNILEQAKEMEKQHIIDAFDVACEDENRIGQEYYNQTFNK
jgi:hypothetical protein